MNPTGTPSTAAGLPAPSLTSSSSRNRAVGALPTATTAPSSRSRHSSSAAALRVVPSLRARSGTRGSPSMQSTSFPAGRRPRVTPDATMFASHSTGAPDRRAFRAADTTPGDQARSVTRSTMPQAWIIRTATLAMSSGRPARSASARMVAKDRR